MTKMRLVMFLPLALGACDTGPVSEAKAAVKRDMLDESSAKFREVSQCSNDRSLVRGEVNGRNAYGAYTGFKPFYYIDGRARTELNAGDEYDAFLTRCFGEEIVKKTRAEIKKYQEEHGVKSDAMDPTPAP